MNIQELETLLRTIQSDSVPRGLDLKLADAIRWCERQQHKAAHRKLRAVEQREALISDYRRNHPTSRCLKATYYRGLYP